MAPFLKSKAPQSHVIALAKTRQQIRIHESPSALYNLLWLQSPDTHKVWGTSRLIQRWCFIDMNIQPNGLRLFGWVSSCTGLIGMLQSFLIVTTIFMYFLGIHNVALAFPSQIWDLQGRWLLGKVTSVQHFRSAAECAIRLNTYVIHPCLIISAK